MGDDAFDTAFREYSEKRNGKDFWKSDLLLKIENDIKTGEWTKVADADEESEARLYRIYSSRFDTYMNLPDDKPLSDFTAWFNGNWGEGTPSKKMFKEEVINKFPTVAILVSKHAKIRTLINNFKNNHKDEFLSLKTSYMLDSIRDKFKDTNDTLSSAYSEIMRSKLPPDEGFRSAPITDNQYDKINREFFRTRVYQKPNQAGGKTKKPSGGKKKTRRARRKSKKSRRT